MAGKKIIRPGRIIPDPYEAAVVVEYTVETLDHSTGQVRLLLKCCGRRDEQVKWDEKCSWLSLSPSIPEILSDHIRERTIQSKAPSYRLEYGHQTVSNKCCSTVQIYFRNAC